MPQIISRKSRNCRRIREMFSPYLDERLTPLERAEVEGHAEACEECHNELQSLYSTVGLLRRMPIAVPVRSFTLNEAEAGRSRVPFAIPKMGWLRVTTAAAAIVLVTLVAGDVAGTFNTASRHGKSEVATVSQNNIPATDGISLRTTPSATPTPDTSGVSTFGEAPQATQPSGTPEITAGVAGLPDGSVDLSAPTQATPNGREAQDITTPSSKTLTKESAYFWLRPAEITFAAIILILGGINLLAWRRKRVSLS